MFSSARPSSRGRMHLMNRWCGSPGNSARAGHPLSGTRSVSSCRMGPFRMIAPTTTPTTAQSAVAGAISIASCPFSGFAVSNRTGPFPVWLNRVKVSWSLTCATTRSPFFAFARYRSATMSPDRIPAPDMPASVTLRKQSGSGSNCALIALGRRCPPRGSISAIGLPAGTPARLVRLQDGGSFPEQPDTAVHPGVYFDPALPRQRDQMRVGSRWIAEPECGGQLRPRWRHAGFRQVLSNDVQCFPLSVGQLSRSHLGSR